MEHLGERDSFLHNEGGSIAITFEIKLTGLLHGFGDRLIVEGRMQKSGHYISLSRLYQRIESYILIDEREFGIVPEVEEGRYVFLSNYPEFKKRTCVPKIKEITQKEILTGFDKMFVNRLKLVEMLFSGEGFGCPLQIGLHNGCQFVTETSSLYITSKNALCQLMVEFEIPE